MHVPRDAAEWAVMAVLMAAVMTVGMVGMHSIRTHLAGPSRTADHGPMQPGIRMAVVTRAVQLLLSLGVPISILGPMMLLTVRGRTSGRPRTLPVDVHDVGGRRYLIASHGIAAWVLNLRASGEGSLRLGRRRLEFTARELEPAEAGHMIRAAFAKLIASDGWRGEGIRNNLGVGRTSTDAEFEASARDHPVFELRPRDSGRAR